MKARKALGALALAGATVAAGSGATLASAAASPAASSVRVCSDGSYGGRFYCGGVYGSGESWVTLPNGTRELFVTGTNHQLYTRWTYRNGTRSNWLPMGGWLKSRPVVQDYAGASLTVVGIGGDSRTWARDRSATGHWSAWHKTGPGYFVFDKNSADPTNSRLTWLWAKNSGGAPSVGSATWRAGSGKGSENDCATNQGWLPDGWYPGISHTTYNSSKIPTMNWYVGDKACHIKGRSRTELFIHSKTPSSWAASAHPYWSDGCIHLSPKDILAADRYSRAHGGPGYGRHRYDNLLLVIR